MKDTEVMMASNITRDLRFSELMFNFAARAETRMAREAQIQAPRASDNPCVIKDSEVSRVLE